MKYAMVFFWTALLFSAWVNDGYAKREGSLTEALENPGYVDKPDWFKVSFLDLYEDIDEAAARDKRVVIYFYQDGCPYCKKLLEDNLAQRDIAATMQGYFDVVAINIWGDQEVTVGDRAFTEKTFAEALKVQYTPSLLFFNRQYKAVFRANGYYPPARFRAMLNYVGQKKENDLSFQDYLRQFAAPAASGKLYTDLTTLTDPANLQRPQAGKPLLVLFEQRQCTECDELHQDILRREQSRSLLAQFDIVVLDMWSDDGIITPSGERLKIRDWVRKLGLQYAPAMVYFDRTGQEVFRSDAYLKAFHIQSAMDYIASGAYRRQANFQRFIEARADRLREAGIEVNLMD